MTYNLISLKKAQDKTNKSRSQIYVEINDPDSDFPRPIKSGKRSISFIEAELDEWIKKRIEMSRQGMDAA